MEWFKGRVLPEKVLAASGDAKLAEVFVLGFRPDGEIYLAASTDDPDSLRDLLVEASELVDQLERQVLEDEDDQDDEDGL